MGAMWILFTLTFLIDLPVVLKKRNKKSIVVFSLLLIPAIVLTILTELDVQIPSLIMLLGNAVKSIGIQYSS